MILDLNYEFKSFNDTVLPYIKNGIFIDTSVIKIFIDGFINLRFSKKESDEYSSLINFLELIKVKNQWNKFFITPHVLSETFRHLNVEHNNRKDYKDIIDQILPIFQGMIEEENLSKNNIIEMINLKKPVIEIGDLSIFLAIKNLSGKKISILVKDKAFNERYESNPNVLIMDYSKIINNKKYASH